MAMFIQFLCLCPLGLAINLNFNISKVAYCYKGSSMKTAQLLTVKTALSCYPSVFLLNISLTFCVLWLLKHCLHVTCRCALIFFFILPIYCARYSRLNVKPRCTSSARGKKYIEDITRWREDMNFKTN